MAYEGALDTAITLLIIIAFNSDFSLGVITSIISILAVFSSIICKKIIDPQKTNLSIILSCIVIFISTIFLIFITNQYTIIGYNIIFAFFIQFIMIAEEVQTLKLTNSTIIDDSNRVESYILIEFFLNAGRVLSYILLFILGISNKLYLLETLIIFLELSLVGMIINLIQIQKLQNKLNKNKDA